MEPLGPGNVRGLVLEIGNAFRGAVVRQDKFDGPPMWLASVNTAYLGEYLDRVSAMNRVQAEIESNMEMVLHDWGLYQAAKQKQLAWR
jgi:hypothetical protein